MTTAKKHTHTITFYRDAIGEWRWRAEAINGRIVAESGEGYKRRGNAVRAALNLLAGPVLVENATVPAAEGRAGTVA